MARTNAASSPDSTVKLGAFEGKDVLSTAVSVTNAGDGLSKALAVEPVEMHVGDRGIIALEYEVAKVRFDPVTDTQGLQRVHILRAGAATFIDEETVATALEEQQRKIDAHNGVFHLPFEVDGEGGDGAENELTDPEWEDSARTDDTAGG